MRILVATIGLSLCVLTGCGSSGGDASTPAAVADAKMGGIWEGTSTWGGETQTLIGVTTDDGRFRFVSLDTDGQYVGSISVSNQNQISGSGTGVAPDGSLWSDGSKVATVSLSGTLSERDSLTGSWSSSTGESGNFNLNFDPIYDRPSSLAKVSGTYTAYEEDGPDIVSITIDSGGSINGQDIFGCIYSGMMSLIDSEFNVYEITLTLANCGADNRTVTGLAGLFDGAGTDDRLLTSVDDGNSFSIDFLNR